MGFFCKEGHLPGVKSFPAVPGLPYQSKKCPCRAAAVLGTFAVQAFMKGDSAAVCKRA